MSPSNRTPQQRDRRFARVRNLTMTIFVGSGVVSAVFVGYAASIVKPVTTTTPTTSLTTPATAPVTTTTPSSSGTGSTSGTTPTTVYTPPTTAPVTTTTVCTTTPSGTTTCY